MTSELFQKESATTKKGFSKDLNQLMQLAGYFDLSIKWICLQLVDALELLGVALLHEKTVF